MIKIPDPEGFQQKDQHAAGKVAQASLQRETNCHAGGTHKGHHACGIKAEIPGYHEHQQSIQARLDQSVEKLYDPCFHIRPLE